MADTPIPIADLPKVAPGTLDSVVGVDESTGEARRFGVNDLPLPAAAETRLAAVEAGQVAGMLGYATKADMDADLAHAAGALALVTNDPTTANNGTYRKTGASGAGSWVLSADRVTGLESDVAALEAYKTKAEPATDALFADAQIIGAPAGTITDGTTSAAGNTYTLAVPLKYSGSKLRFAYYGRGTGTAYVQIHSRSGTTNTVVSEVAVSVTPGYHEVELTLAYSAGQYFGLRTIMGLIAIASGNPGYTYWSAVGAVTPGGTFDATTANTVIFKMRYTAVPQIASGVQVAANIADIDALEAQAGVPADTTQWLGGPGSAAPVTGSAIGAQTYAVATPASRDMMVKRIRAYVLAPGTITIRRFTKVGNDFTAVAGDLAVTFSATGLQDGVLSGQFKLAAGQYYAITKAAGVVAVTATAPSDGGYYDGAGDSMAFTDAAATTAYTIQMGVELEPYTLDRRLSRLEAASDPQPATPDSYLVVWGLGESHMAGRGEALSSVQLPAGAAYKFIRSSGTLVAMVDPTGNDATALGGKGSCGPALARAVWEATAGAMGVIFVNSGEGSTYIGTNWASAGSAWTTAVSDYNAAVAAINSMKLPVSGAVAYLAIGSNDAALGTTKAAFKTAVLDLLSRVQLVAGAEVPMVLSLTGPFTDGSYAAGVSNVTAAQRELANENASIHLGYDGAKGFVSRGLMLDNVHFVQAGNDIVGRALAPALLHRGLGVAPLGVT